MKLKPAKENKKEPEDRKASQSVEPRGAKPKATHKRIKEARSPAASPAKPKKKKESKASDSVPRTPKSTKTKRRRRDKSLEADSKSAAELEDVKGAKSKYDYNSSPGSEQGLGEQQALVKGMQDSAKDPGTFEGWVFGAVMFARALTLPVL